MCKESHLSVRTTHRKEQIQIGHGPISLSFGHEAKVFQKDKVAVAVMVAIGVLVRERFVPVVRQQRIPQSQVILDSKI